MKLIIIEFPDYSEQRLIYSGNGAAGMEHLLDEIFTGLVIEDIIHFLKDMDMLNIF